MSAVLGNRPLIDVMDAQSRLNVFASWPVQHIMPEDRAMTEIGKGGLQDRAVAMAGRFRWLTYRPRQGRAGWSLGSGYPDMTCARPPRLVYIECKREGEQLSDKQVIWRDRLLAVPGVEWYLVRPSDLRSGLLEAILT